MSLNIWSTFISSCSLNQDPNRIPSLQLTDMSLKSLYIRRFLPLPSPPPRLPPQCYLWKKLSCLHCKVSQNLDFLTASPWCYSCALWFGLETWSDLGSILGQEQFLSGGVYFHQEACTVWLSLFFWC